MGLAVIHKIFPTFGLNVELNEQNIVMDLNNVMDLNDMIHPTLMPPTKPCVVLVYMAFSLSRKTLSKDTGIRQVMTT